MYKWLIGPYLRKDHLFCWLPCRWLKATDNLDYTCDCNWQLIVCCSCNGFNPMYYAVPGIYNWQYNTWFWGNSKSWGVCSALPHSLQQGNNKLRYCPEFIVWLELAFPVYQDTIRYSAFFIETTKLHHKTIWVGRKSEIRDCMCPWGSVCSRNPTQVYHNTTV